MKSKIPDIQPDYSNDLPDQVIVSPSLLKIIVGLIRYSVFPIFLSTYALSTEMGRDIFLGLDRTRIFAFPLIIITSFLFYKYMRHVINMEKCNKKYIKINKKGVYYCGESQFFPWKSIKSFRISHLSPVFFFGYDSFVIKIRGSGAGECNKERSLRWRLDATNVDRVLFVFCAKYWHKRSKS